MASVTDEEDERIDDMMSVGTTLARKMESPLHSESALGSGFAMTGVMTAATGAYATVTKRVLL
ncbi:hypothetical protein [Zymobacter palmae]|nr:hypothetical protein [Zymobacter palmae]